MITALIFLLFVALGIIGFAAAKAESVVIREAGRAVMWAGLFGLVFLIAREVPLSLR